jgi:hypothetical protein
MRFICPIPSDVFNVLLYLLNLGININGHNPDEVVVGVLSNLRIHFRDLRTFGFQVFLRYLQRIDSRGYVEIRTSAGNFFRLILGFRVLFRHQATSAPTRASSSCFPLFRAL